ncbi:MAG: hypothetical protein Q7S09_04585 [bacterium]|nr:hypothetical protein [bacterium]
MPYLSFSLSLWSSVLSAMSIITHLLYGAGMIPVQSQGTPPSQAANAVEATTLSAVLFFAPIALSLVLTLLRIKRIGRAEGLGIASLVLNGFSLAYGAFAILVFSRD